MAVKYKRKRVMAAKVETTIGTAETLTGSEGAYNAYNVMIQPTIAVEEREAQGGFNYLAGVPGARMGVATFRTDLGWDGTATLPSWATVLLAGCGWVNSAGTVTPRSEAPGTNVKTLTIGCFQDGVFKSIAGAVGTAQLVLPSGRMGYIDWTFTGTWQAVTDTAIIAPTYPTALPIKFSSAVVAYNSVNVKVEQVTFDFGNNVVMREDASTASGYSSGVITNRNPRISVNPESVAVSSLDVYGIFAAGTQAEFSVTLDGPSDSTIQVVAAKAQPMNVQEGDRNGIVVDDIELACQKNATTNDSELNFVFTEAT